MTGFQGGHNHDSEIEDTQNETKLTASLAQRSYTWLKAGLITATPRLKAYTKMAKARYKDVCKVYAKRYNKKRTKAVASNTNPPPTTIEKALNPTSPPGALFRTLRFHMLPQAPHISHATRS